MTGKPTPPLDEFLPLYDADDNVWWAMDSGHHMNLFDEAVDRMQTAEARLSALTDAIEVHKAQHGPGCNDERRRKADKALWAAAAVQPPDPWHRRVE